MTRIDVTKTHGAFSWNELMTTDTNAAKAFYGALFGWTIETMDMQGGAYHVVKAAGEPVGGMMTIPGQAAGMPPTWCSYVTVDDVDAVVERCKALGGTLCAPPMDIPSVGRFAVIQDPQGATVNVIAYTQPA